MVVVPGHLRAALRDVRRDGERRFWRRLGQGLTAAMTRTPAPSAFEALVLPHLDDAYNLARWLVRNTPDAEDVMQEAMLRALRYFASFNGTNPRAWLLQIVRNAAYAQLRRTQGTQTVPLSGTDGDGSDHEWSADAVVDPQEDPETVLAKAQERQQLDALLEALPVDLRECLVLRELKECSYKEIAVITETPIGTVMSRLWRARRMLVKLAAESLRS
jgi:RNA polymerase sigma-70 factor (ECF subfamily)